MSNYTLLDNKVREYKNFVTNAEAAELVSYLETNASAEGNVNLINLDTLPPTIEAIKNRALVELKDISGSSELGLKVLKLWKHPKKASTSPATYFDFSFTILLNDEYEGGELIIPSKNISIKSEALSLLVFDGKDPYGVDVVEGEFVRYSMGGSVRLPVESEAPGADGPDR